MALGQGMIIPEFSPSQYFPSHPLSILSRISNYRSDASLPSTNWEYAPQCVYAYRNRFPPKPLSLLSRISSVTRTASPPPSYPYSRISVAAVPIFPHLPCHDCPPPISTSNLVCHSHYPASLPRLHCHPPASLLRSSSHYIPSSRVLFPPSFVSLLGSDLLLALHCSTLHFLLRSDLY